MLSLLLASSVAWPCAGLFTDSSEIASSDAQEVILRLGEDTTEIEYNVRYEGDAEDFGWIIPISGAFVELAEADAALFDEYRSLTAPWYTELGGGEGGGCGCSDSAKSGGLENRADTASDFGLELASGFSGSYEYTVLDGANTAAVLAWLDDNGWDAGEQSEALSIYSLYDFDFVAIKLVPDSPVTGGGGRLLEPVRITTEGQDLHFPAIMSYYGMLDSYRTTVWIEGEGRAVPVEGNKWTAVDFGTRPATDLSLSPVEQFDQMLYDLGGADKVYAVTWAGESASGTFLTRFDSNTARETNDADPRWEIGKSTDTTRAEITAGEADSGSAAALVGLLPLLGLGWARRRQQR